MAAPEPHAVLLPPSPWVTRFASLVKPGGRVLDVACGAGRHARCFAERGYVVDAVDIDITNFANPPSNVRPLQADIENGPWPYAPGVFDGVVVTNYLWRPLFAALLNSLAPEGVLIYETFALGNERYGRPSRPEFLLKPGELLEIVRGRLRVVAFEDVYVDAPKPAMVQRICARRET